MFEINLLRDITSNITISGTSFESRAVVYNENFRHVDIKRPDHLHTFGRNSKDEEHPWKLTEKRVEDAWFLWTLVQFFKEKGLLNVQDFATASNASQRKDLDTLCEDAWNHICSAPHLLSTSAQQPIHGSNTNDR